MGFFKKVGSKVGGFFKTVAQVGGTVLSTAATIVGGPVAGALVTKVVGLLGEKKVGEMASKVVNDGTVKVDKVLSTLDQYGIKTDANTVNDVVQALKSAASGIGNKSISVSSASLISDVSTGGTQSGLSIMDKVKSMYYRSKDWLVVNWKQAVLYGGIAIVICVAIYLLVFKKIKYRR